MTLRYIQALAILLWGFQTELWWFAIPMAIILEARFYLNRRWTLDKQDFYRTSDLTALGLVALVVFLFVNRAEYHFISTLIAWLPILFFPLTTVLAFSTTERMPLDVLFYSLRRQREPVTQSWDMNYIFFGMCLVSAGTNTDATSWFLPVAGTLILFSLYELRSRRYRLNVFILAAVVVFLSAVYTQQGLRGAHLAIKQQTREWLAEYIRNRTNVLKTKSSIGVMGRLKQSGEILFRVEPVTEPRPPNLLQEATYNVATDNDWMILNPQFESVRAVDDFRWRLAGPGPEERLKIYMEFNRDIGIAPVPASVTEIYDLPAMEVKKSKFGSIQGTGLVPSPGYEVSYRYGADNALNSPPDGSDLLVPTEYAEAIDIVIADTDPGADPVTRIKAALRDFRYSLYQDLTPSEDPIVNFLLEAKKGHCEYFASATVMMLRYLGVPARYAVGYSVQEYNEALDMYVVRERHAHAWAIGYIDGEWRTVDTTPQIWAENEAAESGFLQPVADFISNNSFLLQVWWSETKLEDYETQLYIIGAVLLVILIWRIATGEQVIIGNREDEEDDSRGRLPGGDSPFFRIESQLSESGLRREPGESFTTWLSRIGHTELMPLLSIHNQLRFDPRGPDRDQRSRLEQDVEDWLASNPAEDRTAV